MLTPVVGLKCGGNVGSPIQAVGGCFVQEDSAAIALLQSDLDIEPLSHAHSLKGCDCCMWLSHPQHGNMRVNWEVVP